MSQVNVIQLILIIVGIMLSAFFSSSETALTSLNVFKIRQMEKNGVENASLVKKLVDDIGSVLTTILIGNNIVNIVTTTIATIFFTDVFGSKGAVISPIILTIVVLIFGEITPKNIATSNSEKLALSVAKPIRVVDIIFKPLSFLLGNITNFISSIFVGEEEDNNLVTEEDLKTIVDVSEEQGVINNEESEMINNVFEFGNSDVSDIMTPRTNMEAISIDVDSKELNELLSNTNHSRIPVYGKNIDNILGILHMKDIVSATVQGKDLDLKDLIRPAYYVYDNMHIFDLFTNMRSENASLAVVIDEYGGTSGLVAIEDIVEELVGEIDDEYDIDDKDIFKLTENSYLVKASLHLSDFNDYFNVELEEIKNDSIGGFVIDHLSRIPEAGDSIEVNKMLITVDEVDRYKIEMLKVEFL
ncbi:MULTISPECIES: hemolysin family protein [Anaerococcus]|uniref:hemolysin family protein n=1 Tax=Anaerococcus TaxID=165779 RepID=UPI001AE5B7A0|nr:MULTISPECIES: hemolysin family protein [Anaerococcus]MBP2070445.1 putative hemolysin [Anaerococcus nagyae]MDU2352993.1 hemolysin family protein [Anaerococcus sp.]MDU2565937.1 hemolysin family protein [Anaerococcus sp.]MDU3211967.1 hemolysin family protein [Anaerococcus sp.]